ncbi:MAG: putative ABC transporter permease [Clostridia bacterium]
MQEKTKNKLTSINEKSNKSFASGLNFFKLFWIFYIGCFAGVLVETIWCRLTNGFFESRTALVLGPFNPVYGVGALLITICFIKLTHKSNTWIFFACAFVGAAFEYFCSFFQEMIFGCVSWSYAADSLGIFQRTSLIYALFWGVLGIIWVRILYPFLSKYIEKIPNNIGKYLSFLLMALILFDMIFSSLAVYRQQQRRQNIAATNFIQHFYDKHYSDDVLKKIYPHMTPVN